MECRVRFALKTSILEDPTLTPLPLPCRQLHHPRALLEKDSLPWNGRDHPARAHLRRLRNTARARLARFDGASLVRAPAQARRPTAEPARGALFEVRRPSASQSMPSSDAQSALSMLSPGALDLVRGLLTYDPTKRLLADAALAMPYFTTEDPPMQLPSQCVPFMQKRADSFSSLTLLTFAALPRSAASSMSSRPSGRRPKSGPRARPRAARPDMAVIEDDYSICVLGPLCSACQLMRSRQARGE